MNGKTHLLFGLAVGVDVGFMLVPGADCFTFMAGAALGSVLPDIDTPKSVLGEKLPMISYPLNKIFGHRTITHAPLIPAGVLLLNTMIHAVLPYPMGLNGFIMGLCFGVLLHIIQDILTYKGVPLLYPFIRKANAQGRYFSLRKAGSNDIMNIFITLGMISIVYAVINFHATPLTMISAVLQLFKF